MATSAQRTAGARRRMIVMLALTFAPLLAAARAEALFNAELVFDHNPTATGYNVYARFEHDVGPAPTETERKVTYLASASPGGWDGRVRVVMRDLPVGPKIVFTVTVLNNGKESPRSNQRSLTYDVIARYIDSDGDGLLDYEEDFDLDLVVDADETDPSKADTDGDGLTDFTEIYTTQTDPRGRDSDGDGTVDGRDTCNDMDRDGFGSAGAGATCAWDNCPFVYNRGQTDADYDSEGDACDPCTNVGNLQTFDSRSDAVTFRKVYDDGVIGNDIVAMRGEFDLPSSTSFDSLDPSVEGARIVFKGASGRTLTDIKLPTGIKQSGSLRGWKIDPRGNKFRYIDQSADRIGGIVKLVAKDMGKRAPRRVRIALKGRDGDYPVSPEDSPVQAIVVLGNSDASKQGACGETAFSINSCELKKGKTMLCR